MAEHTAGPWSVYTEVVGTRFAAMQELCRLVHGTTEFSGKLPMVVVPSGLCAAVTGCGPDGEANARLIAAAPDLLAALQDIDTAIRGLPEGLEGYLQSLDEPVAAARAAVAKATGDSHG